MGWDEYQQKSQGRSATYLARYAVNYTKILNQKIKSAIGTKSNERPIAIDIGCGSGVDSIFFARQGYTVYAVDQSTRVIENAVQMLFNKGYLTEEQVDNIHIINSDFDKIAKGEVELPKADIVYSNLSLPFYTPQNSEDYGKLMNVLTNSLSEGGVVATTMLGKNDEWKNCSLQSGEDIQKYYKGLARLEDNEREVNAVCQDGTDKHWDVIESVYRKPFNDEKTEEVAGSISPEEPINMLADDLLKVPTAIPSPISQISQQVFERLNENSILPDN